MDWEIRRDAESVGGKVSETEDGGVVATFAAIADDVSATELETKMAEAREKAKSKKESGDINKLLAFDVNEETVDEARERALRAQKRKEEVQALAGKIKTAETKIKAIESVPDWENDSRSVTERNKIVAFLKSAYDYGDNVFKESLFVATLIKDIVTTVPCESGDVAGRLKYVAEIGRGKMMNEETAKKANGGKLPLGAVVFDKVALCHVKSDIYPNDVASPADKKLFYELRKLVERYFESARKNKIAKIRDNKGITDLSKLLDRYPGVYKIHFPERKDERTGKRWDEGVGLVEVANIGKGELFWVIKALDGAGSLHWLVKKDPINKGMDPWVPLAAAWTGRVIEDKIAPERLEFAKKFAKMLAAACGPYKPDRREEAMAV